MSLRGDRERDVAALERELAFEHQRLSNAADNGFEAAYRRLADLHLRAAGLLEELAAVYDTLDEVKTSAK